GEADPAALQSCAAYLELHIEQGKLLEDAGLDVGIVTHALAQSWYEVVVEGEDAHGGSPMAGRRDAMMAAAPLISAVEEIALPTVMIFTPCHGGLSHNEAESITPAWAAAGLQVLADAVLATANSKD